MSRDVRGHRIGSGKSVVAAQMCLLLACAGWLWGDPLAERSLSLMGDVVREPFQSRSWAMLPHVAGWWRMIAIAMVGGMLLFTAGAEFLRFLRRRSGNVSIRRLLSVIALVGAWCALSLQSQNLIWEGKRWRAERRLTALDRLANELTQDWPSEDGEIDGLGPFTAYPFGKPQVLLLLNPYPLEGADMVIAAIERGADGQLRFQLGGADGGVWVELHNAESRPQSFVGGLADTHELSRTAELTNGWYLVRYGS